MIHGNANADFMPSSEERGRHRALQVRHLVSLHEALSTLDEALPVIEEWGRVLARVLAGGGRLLAVGNGGSAAQAQHLTAELVGRYVDERQPLSALALHSETSSLTAIANDYGVSECFARQVRAHGRRGDVLLALSTSGKSENIVHAARAAREHGLVVWALTGPAPNPLVALVDSAIAVDARATPTVQEVHLVVVHMLCAVIDEELHGIRDVRHARDIDAHDSSARASVVVRERSPVDALDAFEALDALNALDAHGRSR